MWIAIGTDGTRHVVWGHGDSADAAEREAEFQQERQRCAEILTQPPLEVPDAVLERIYAGAFACEQLGLIWDGTQWHAPAARCECGTEPLP